MMTIIHTLGLPRIGGQRELKVALEQFWRGELDDAGLHAVGRQIRADNWQAQVAAGLDLLTVGDFAWYDPTLSLCCDLGCLPARFSFAPGTLSLNQQFELARGNAAQPAMEMTKWFDSNYHYLVPEWAAETRFDGLGDSLLAQVAEAQAYGKPLKVALTGPITLLWLGKGKQGLDHKLSLLPRLIPAYQRLLARLQAAGVQWVQLDEPALAVDLPADWLAAYAPTYRALQPQAPALLLATYFGGVAEHVALLAALPVAGLHLDCVRAPAQLAAFLAAWPADRVLSVGCIDGRNIWRADLDAVLNGLAAAARRLGERLWLAPSCSLAHVPVDLALEARLDPELRSWLAFARQKLDELALLKKALQLGRVAVHQALQASRAAATARRCSPSIHNAAVTQRLATLAAADERRRSAFPQRQMLQAERSRLPLLPTTSIGSFPQTADIRAARAAFKRGNLGAAKYEAILQAAIRLAVDKQEQLGLDVLVHGEAERNDMVEYFGEQLAGYAFTDFGWVQSYGSRCVKPPLLFGDISRPQPMTVAWTTYAQSLTAKPMKGMLTGPITLLQWAFVRDDQPRAATARQLALAIRDEVADLAAAGIGIIQIDEPALREGLPLRRADWAEYLDWAVRAFRLASSGVSDDVQIHTHMCYSEFNDILPAIAALDADVITIETSRSDMELLAGFGDFAYPNAIGPGVYDIHSPRAPGRDELLRLIGKALQVIPAARLWINPDCGLKTRSWPETEAALAVMMDAARAARRALAAGLPLTPAASTPPAAHGHGPCGCTYVAVEMAIKSSALLRPGNRDESIAPRY